MKSRLSDIRVEVNILKSKLGEIEHELDTILTKYVNGRLGYKELKKQTGKMIKLKDETLSKISAEIKKIEEIELEADSNNNSIIKEPLKLVTNI